MGFASEDTDSFNGVVWVTVIIAVFFKHQTSLALHWPIILHYMNQIYEPFIIFLKNLQFDYLKKESDISGMAWGWVNDDRIKFFGWTNYPNQMSL